MNPTVRVAVNTINNSGSLTQIETKKTVDSGKTSGGERVPQALILETFSFLTFSEFQKSLFPLGKKWKPLLTNKAFLKRLYAERGFGERKWTKYFGKVPNAPALPDNIHEIMQKECPVFRDVTGPVIRTHTLFLIPSTVNGKPLTLRSLCELVAKPKEGHPTRFRHMPDEIMQAYGDQQIEQSYWAIMTNKVSDMYINRSYADQCKLLDVINHEMGENYAIPKFLEVAVCIFTKYVSSKVCLYAELPWVLTRCQETVGTSQVSTGGFSADGLCVNFRDTGLAKRGFALLQKLDK